MTNQFATADLCDEHGDLQVATESFLAFGTRSVFHGEVQTLRVFEDNTLVRAELEQPGNGRVLVVDGGASRRCALLGGMLAALAETNDWAGLIVNGCVRDSLEINEAKIGVRALATCPRKSNKRGHGERAVPISFAGIDFSAGCWVYVDEDGIAVADRNLL